MRREVYKTLQAMGQDEFIVHKSRFIGHGAPVKSEEEALAFLAKIREKHKDASHNCYAYIIGQNAGIARYSDDGEPSSTAGMPIMEVIRARGVVDVCVVVTRYFGGILLGAGGLIRAYAQGSKTALDAGHVVQMHLTHRYGFDTDYASVGKLDYFLKDQPVRIVEREFAERVTYDIAVKKSQADAFLGRLEQVSMGRVEPILLEDGYQPWSEQDES